MKIAALKIVLCLAIGALGGAILASAYLAQGDAPRSRELTAVLSAK